MLSKLRVLLDPWRTAPRHGVLSLVGEGRDRLELSVAGKGKDMSKHKCHILEVYRDRSHQWRWRFKSPNGRIICIAGEGYTRKASAARSWRVTLDAIHRGPIDVRTLLEDVDS